VPVDELTSIPAGAFDAVDESAAAAAAALPLAAPVVGVRPLPDGGGYWLVASDGGVFAFGSATFHGRPPTTSPTPPSSTSADFSIGEADPPSGDQPAVVLSGNQPAVARGRDHDPATAHPGRGRAKTR